MEGYTKIGRIRPNYTGAWNAGTAYTVLEMVKNEAGTASYIAKQDVPAGTPLTDEAYWAMVLDAGDVIDAAEKAAERANKAADALGIVQTATGSVIAVGDASDMPFKGLKLFGKTTQDGTPTPDAPVPLVSVGEKGSIGVTACGKNLLPPNILDQSAYTVGYGLPYATVYKLPMIVPDYTYTISCDWNQSEAFYYLYRYETASGIVDDTFFYFIVNIAPSGKRTFTFTAEEGYEYFFYGNNANYLAITLANISNFQIEIGSTATAYEPYKGQTLTAQTPNGLPGIPVTSGGNYTDASGQQWVCDEIDFERNMYVKRIGIVENYSGETITTAYISSTGALTAGAYIQYILAEPTETALTAEEIAAYRALHTNKPNTTVFNDAGAEMEVKYVADTKLYIDNKFAALQEAIINA